MRSEVNTIIGRFGEEGGYVVFGTFVFKLKYGRIVIIVKVCIVISFGGRDFSGIVIE